MSAFRTELSKLASRPAVWVLGAAFVAIIVLFGYALGYLFIAGIDGDPPQEAQPFVEQLLPGQFLLAALSNFTNFGSAIAVILGAMAMGSEYRWDTFKAALSQGSSRLEILGSKLAAIAVILAAFSVVMVGVGALCSYVVSLLLQEGANWPSLWEIVRGVGAGWLILAVFGAMGLALAAVFRGVGLAIGLGLVYVLVLEGIFNTIAAQSDAADSVSRALPLRNSLDLGRAFGDLPQAQGVAQTGAIGPAQASLVLGAYLVGFLVIAVALFKLRDVA